jgi:hypothetical protein
MQRLCLFFGLLLQAPWAEGSGQKQRIVATRMRALVLQIGAIRYGARLVSEHS